MRRRTLKTQRVAPRALHPGATAKNRQQTSTAPIGMGARSREDTARAALWEGMRFFTPLFHASAPLVQGRRLLPLRWAHGQRGEEVDVEKMTVDAYCELVYGKRWDADEKSRKSKRNTVSRMCRDGVLQYRKAGRRWLIEL